MYLAPKSAAMSVRPEAAVKSARYTCEQSSTTGELELPWNKEPDDSLLIVLLVLLLEWSPLPHLPDADLVDGGADVVDGGEDDGAVQADQEVLGAGNRELKDISKQVTSLQRRSLCTGPSICIRTYRWQQRSLTSWGSTVIFGLAVW